MKTALKTFPLAATLILAAACTDGTKTVTTASGLNPADFDSVIDGRPTALYTLTNADGMEVCITNFGGRVVSIMVPDREGNLTDVVLGHDDIASYTAYPDGNFGAIIGRYGNRIANGRFTIDSVEYQLPQNNFGHCLHGGPRGFHDLVWDATQPNDSTLNLTLTSPDGDMGFPGNLIVEVTYTLQADNALRVDYAATTDAATIVNLTNHSYFNLTGKGNQNVLAHELMINANGITPVDSTFMTTGEIITVEGTPFDFTAAKPIGRDIEADDAQLRYGRGYDHNFVLATNGSLDEPAATVYNPENGILLSLYTTEPGLQLYTGNFLDGTEVGKNNVAHTLRTAVCLEPQHYPDTPNKPQWPSCLLLPDQTYTTTTIYRFTTR